MNLCKNCPGPNVRHEHQVFPDMPTAEERFWQDCDASLARVRAVRAATDETWDDPAVAADLDELQAGVDAHERDEERRLAERALRPGETPFP